MASYRQIAKGNWRVTISLGMDVNGNRKRVSKQGFKTKREAQAYADRIEQRKREGYIESEGSNMLFGDYITKWYTEYKQFNIGINTRIGYESRIERNIKPLLGKYKLKDLNNQIIQDFYNTLISKKKHKPATAKKNLDAVISCLKYAKKNKLIYEVPTDIEKQKIEKPDIKVWEKKHINFFLKTLEGTYLHVPIYIDVLTGLRISELCGLRWCDVDFNMGLISITSQLIYDTETKSLFLGKLKTQSSNRIISIPQVLNDYLKNLKKIRKARMYDYIVLDREGKPYNPKSLSTNFTNKVAEFLEPQDEDNPKENYMQLPKISFHGLRHTHATMLIANGENVKVVSERLGHSDISMTLSTYTHVGNAMNKNTANLLEKMFG